MSDAEKLLQGNAAGQKFGIGSYPTEEIETSSSSAQEDNAAEAFQQTHRSNQYATAATSSANGQIHASSTGAVGLRDALGLSNDMSALHQDHRQSRLQLVQPMAVPQMMAFVQPQVVGVSHLYNSRQMELLAQQQLQRELQIQEIYIRQQHQEQLQLLKQQRLELQSRRRFTGEAMQLPVATRPVASRGHVLLPQLQSDGSLQSLAISHPYIPSLYAQNKRNWKPKENTFSSIESSSKRSSQTSKSSKRTRQDSTSSSASAEILSTTISDPSAKHPQQPSTISISSSNDLSTSPRLDDHEQKAHRNPPTRRADLPEVNTPKTKNTSSTTMASSTNMNVEVNNAKTKKKRDLYHTPAQLLCDEIDIMPGLVFQELDDSSEDLDPAERFLSRPNVNRWKPNQKRKRNSISKSRKNRKGKGHQEATAAEEKTSGPQKQKYTARLNMSGVSVNLGSDHNTSTSAAAALDIAHKLFHGREHNRPFNVLSECELRTALNAVQYDEERIEKYEFRKKFTLERKKIFEEVVQMGLSSIGGRDDVYADLLCDMNKMDDHDSGGCKRKKGQKEKKTKNTKKSEYSYEGQHLVYTVDDDGLFSYKLDDSFPKEP